MGEFRYKALDQSGREYSKTIEADSLHDAANQLRSAEVNLIGLETSDTGPRRYEPAGLRPAPAPRDVEVRLRDQTGGTVLLMVGGIFASIASIFIVVGLGMLLAGESEGLFFALFPMIHFAVGAGLLVFMFRSRAKRRRIYRDGEVAMATIEGVGYNRKVRVNGSNPYELVWTFDLDGHRYHDKRSTFNEQAMTFVPGDRMWVLYDPADPEESVEWPQLK